MHGPQHACPPNVGSRRGHRYSDARAGVHLERDHHDTKHTCIRFSCRSMLLIWVAASAPTTSTVRGFRAVGGGGTASTAAAAAGTASNATAAAAATASAAAAAAAGFGWKICGVVRMRQHYKTELKRRPGGVLAKCKP